MRGIVAVAAILLAHPSAGQSPRGEDSFVVGGWYGEAIYRGAAFQRCLLTAPANADGILFGLMLSPDLLQYYVQGDRWRLREGEAVDAKVEIAGALSQWTSLEAIGETISVGRLERPEAALDAIARGRRIMIAVPGRVMVFDLSGRAAADGGA